VVIGEEDVDDDDDDIKFLKKKRKIPEEKNKLRFPKKRFLFKKRGKKEGEFHGERGKGSAYFFGFGEE